MTYILIYERYETYHLLQKVKKTIKKLQQRRKSRRLSLTSLVSYISTKSDDDSIQLTKKEKLTLALQTIFFLEWKTFLNLPKSKQEKYMEKMQIIQFCSEDIFFLGVGIYLENYYFLDFKINYIALVSLLISFFSSIVVIKF